MPFLSFYSDFFFFNWALVAYICLFGLVEARISTNGQIFTNGLAILNSPSRNTPFRVGAKLPISIEVSGNGKLPAPALIPGSGLSTHYDALHIYLVSSQSNTNLTVSIGKKLLTGETGSVRHLDWPIPACTPAGPYNLTFYEFSHINDEPYFVITPIPISIENSSPSQCLSGVNDLHPQPQLSSPFARPPFLPGAPISINTKQAGLAVTQSPSRHTTVNEPTTPAISSVTIMVVSVVTVTTTELGIPMTTTFTTTKTTMAAMQTADNSGFFPVNASPRIHTLNLFPLSGILGLWILRLAF